MRYTTLTYLKIAFAILVIGGLTLYAYFQSREYLRGPMIEIVSPINGSTVYEDLVHIRGKARNISYLSVNDREISTDTLGNFDETLLLAPGYSIITLKARDRFDRERLEKVELWYKMTPNAKFDEPVGTTSPSVI